jgi:hypothetical protein
VPRPREPMDRLGPRRLRFKTLNRVRKDASHRPIGLRGCATSPLRPYGLSGRLGAIKPTTATTTATPRLIRDQRFGGFFICWSCSCCPAVFVCGSDFAGFCIGSCGTGDRFRFGFFRIAEDDLTFGFFGFFTGSASAFVALIVVGSPPPHRRAALRHARPLVLRPLRALDRYSASNGDFVLVWRLCHAALRPTARTRVSRSSTTLIEPVKLRSPLGLKPSAALRG